MHIKLRMNIKSLSYKPISRASLITLVVAAVLVNTESPRLTGLDH